MKLRLLILILTLGIATSASAQWEQTKGPFGGAMSSMAQTAEGFLAVIGQDLYNYQNNSWSLKEKDWRGQLVQAGNTILSAHVESAKVTTDEGKTWRDTKLPSDHVEVQFNTFLSISSDSLFESANGIDWTFRSKLPQDPMNFTVNHGSLFCFSGWNGLMRSDDGGKNWELLPNQPPFQTVTKWISTGSALFALPYPSGVYRTTDNGATWEAMHRNLYEGTMFEGVAQSGDDIFISDWLTTYRLVDDYWTEVPVAKIRTSLIAKGTLYMATEAGLMSFKDNKISSHASNLVATNVTKMGSTGQSLFAKTQSGLYRTQNGGESWELNRNTYAEDIATAKGSILIRGTSILRSTDEGNTWSNIDPAFDEFIVSPTRLIDYQGNLYLTSGLVSSGEHGSGAGWTTGGVYRSTDGGESWYDISTNLPNNGITHVPVFNIVGANGRLLIQTADGIFMRTAESQSWGRATPNVDGMYPQFFSTGDKFMMLMDSVWFTSMNGEYWDALRATAPEDFMHNYEYVIDFSNVRGAPYITTARSVRIDSINYQTFFRNFKLEDNTWIEITDELPKNTVTTTMIEHNGGLYAATASLGVWKKALPQANVKHEDENAVIALYPNPATSFVIIDAKVLSVTNSLGQDVMSTTVITDGRVDISKLSTGFYHIMTDKGSGSFVKQ